MWNRYYSKERKWLSWQTWRKLRFLEGKWSKRRRGERTRFCPLWCSRTPTQPTPRDLLPPPRYPLSPPINYVIKLDHLINEYNEVGRWKWKWKWKWKVFSRASLVLLVYGYGVYIFSFWFWCCHCQSVDIRIRAEVLLLLSHRHFSAFNAAHIYACMCMYVVVNTLSNLDSKFIKFLIASQFPYIYIFVLHSYICFIYLFIYF